ncbi:hypothetical protein LEP1GSC021_2182 [Leptospira noguchii str. 1993005606]|uniref:Uncharacterized protein n=2 Tax=Leptospira noguchii str. 2001034031 TaxID=1193053 RepID=M6YWK6_9LEPT|nr:hypothetical protein LEP1GSC024_4430 [Leptospira noguchii str. 2001034031]EPE85647.1 hypothetical protein LEP1GSC021_2182 [Leptospira noguchii str. 1993005606]
MQESTVEKSLEVIRINSEGSYERQQFSTTENGISNLLNWLNPNDVVGLVFLARKENQSLRSTARW